MLNPMHPARLTAMILIGLAFLAMTSGLIYGAVTTNANVDWTVAWSLSIAAAVLVIAALVCLLLWKRSR